MAFRLSIRFVEEWNTSDVMRADVTAISFRTASEKNGAVGFIQMASLCNQQNGSRGANVLRRVTYRSEDGTKVTSVFWQDFRQCPSFPWVNGSGVKLSEIRPDQIIKIEH